MYGLRLEDGTKVSPLYYKPKVGHIICIDKTDKWYTVTEIVGRLAYCMSISDPRYRSDNHG